MASGVADFNDDAWLSTDLSHDKQAGALVLRLRAKQRIRLTEIQGFTSDVEAFGLTQPAGFEKMAFGQGASIPESMAADLAHMNRLNFRWGCDHPMQAGSELEIRIPASGPGKDRVVLTLTYEYPKLLGLAHGKHGFYARMLPV